ncbi:type II toxin-antitoxin system VapC family toxin [Halogeometricum limi]|uniref:PIN domain-containing protein n=1 Tax=Halogeometricum limi TaxID=555875 RepID=A0A1I6FR58_9EURY|nr:PIN domain-containing protein [Halogeometricum limi]SFR32376.1 hypothetical protein SAMN04488124_0111 [Halogeometricum limi]
MVSAVVDTSVLIAGFDADDERHSTGFDIVRGIDSGDLPTGRVTTYVLLETLNWIHGRNRHDKATETYQRLNASSGFEVHHAPQKDFRRAMELFERYDGIAFGDATIAAYMEREGVEYLYSFDDDFDALDWVNRLEIADRPHQS